MKFKGHYYVGPTPCGITRRDFISRGLATATIATSIPSVLLRSTLASAATPPSCPAQVRVPGAMAQIYRDGGNTRSAMFFDSQLAGVINSNIAYNYGIVGASDLVQVGSNYHMAKSSPYAVAVMTPPPGYSQSTWSAVLAKTSVGVIYGPWNADDGAGVGLGGLGAASPWKASLLGQDVRINNTDTLVNWGAGQPSIAVQNTTDQLAANSVSSLVGLTPSAVFNSAQVTASANAAYNLSSIFSSAFGLTSRSGATTAINKTYCAFSGQSTVADPAFANTSFLAGSIPALTGKISMSVLSVEQQCLLGSFYASAVGTVGAIIIQQNNNDYHGNGAPANSGPVDYEAGMYLQMFLAACDAAGQPGVFIDVSNGNCQCNSVGQVTIKGQGGASVSVHAPNAMGDAGGDFNAGYIICYHPSTPPTMKSLIGSLDTMAGNVTAPGNITSVPQAMGYLYLTAIGYLGGDVNTAFAQMSAGGAFSSGSASSYMLLG